MDPVDDPKGSVSPTATTDDSTRYDPPPVKKRRKTSTKDLDEEKRKEVLEKNRVAAIKCRQRKKQRIQEQESTLQTLQKENATLKQALTQHQEELARLKALFDPSWGGQAI
jgi:ATF/CREB family transcription factor